MVADHLSRLVNDEITKKEKEVVEEFCDEKLLMIQERLWFADLDNHMATNWLPEDLNWQQKKKSLRDSKFYVWYERYLLKIGANNLLRRSATKEKQETYYRIVTIRLMA